MDGVVCGHIHHAEMRDIDGILYANDTSKGTLEALAHIAPDASGNMPLLDAKSIELV
jgi:UDP-2,3-diacylglucosamine pyrophosphatase LpxH